MNFLLLFLITTTVFCIGDCLWIYGVMKPFFFPQIAHVIAKNGRDFDINYISVFAAYMLIIFSLSYFVLYPCLIDCLYKHVFIQGALFGFCMYGMYEFINHAILVSWPLSFVIVDIAWGTFWSGIASVIVVYLMRYFFI